MDTGEVMQNIELNKEKNAVLVPIKDWEKLQNELIRLRKKVNKAKILKEIKAAIIEVEEDLKRPPESRRVTVTADEFLAELKNGK